MIEAANQYHLTKLGSYDTVGNSIGITHSNDGTKAYIADETTALVIIGGIK